MQRRVCESKDLFGYYQISTEQGHVLRNCGEQGPAEQKLNLVIGCVPCLGPGIGKGLTVW